MPLYSALGRMKATLENMETWLDDAVAYAEEREFDPEVLLQTRLYPDMRPLMFQIQGATDAAKLAHARLAGREAPKHADDEKTLEEIRARLRSVIEYLGTFGPDDLAGVEDRSLSLGFLPEGKVIRATDYLFEFALPNFFFHATTAYALLRHAGVKLGKRKFIQSLTLQDV